MSERKNKKGRTSPQAGRKKNPLFGTLACPDCPVFLEARQNAKENGKIISLDDWQCHHEKKFQQVAFTLDESNADVVLAQNGKAFLSTGIPELDNRLKGGIRRSRLSGFCFDKERLTKAFEIGCRLSLQSKTLYCITVDDPIDYDAILDQKRVPTKPVFKHIRCIKQIPTLIEENKPDVVLLSPILAMPYDLVTLWSLAVHYNVAILGVLDEAELSFFDSGVMQIMHIADTVVELGGNLISGTTAIVLKEAN